MQAGHGVPFFGKSRSVTTNPEQFELAPKRMPEEKFTIPPHLQSVCALQVGGPNIKWSPYFCASVRFLGCFPSKEAAADHFRDDKRCGTIMFVPLDSHFCLDGADNATEILDKWNAKEKENLKKFEEDARASRTWEEVDGGKDGPALLSNAAKDAIHAGLRQEAAKKKKTAQSTKKKTSRRDQLRSDKTKKNNSAYTKWPASLRLPSQSVITFALAHDPEDQGDLKHTWVATVFGSESTNDRGCAFQSDCVQHERKANGKLFTAAMYEWLLPDMTTTRTFLQEVPMMYATREQEELGNVYSANHRTREAEAVEFAKLMAAQMNKSGASPTDAGAQDNANNQDDKNGANQWLDREVEFAKSLAGRLDTTQQGGGASKNDIDNGGGASKDDRDNGGGASKATFCGCEQQYDGGFDVI